MIKYLRPFLGIFALLLGVVLFILPIPLGWPVLLVGATLLTPEVKVFRKVINKVEGINPTHGRKLRYFRMKILRFLGYRGETF